MGTDDGAKLIQQRDTIYGFLAEQSLVDIEGEATDGDQSERAENVRQLLLGAVKEHRQRALNRALEVYRDEVRLYQSRHFQPPTKAAERRELLGTILQRFGEGERSFLTLQHREFKNLSDADVESLLKQLEALGVLNAGSR